MTHCWIVTRWRNRDQPFSGLVHAERFVFASRLRMIAFVAWRMLGYGERLTVERRAGRLA